MNCTQCGAKVAAGDKFCSECGTPISAAAPEPPREPQVEKPKPRKSLMLWLVIVGVALVGTYAAMLIPAFVGKTPGTNPPTGLYVMIWTSLFFYLAWRHRGSKGWQGALIGAAVGILAYTGAIILAASNRNLDSSSAAEQFEQATEDIPAFETLRDYEPDTYDRLIVLYGDAVEKGYSEQQIGDLLRRQITELISRRLPRASDEAVITFIKLLVQELGEAQVQGGDLCFRMIYPQVEGGVDMLKVLSEELRQRHHSALVLTIKSFDADRPIPAEDEIWSDLEPIYIDLFDTYGEENVLALENPSALGIDRDMACSINRTLYSKILELPENKAAIVLRWMISPD